MSGRTENDKRDHRQQHRVKPGDHRSADDFSVTHHFRDTEGGQSNAGHDVPKKMGLAKWNKTLEQRQAPVAIA